MINTLIESALKRPWLIVTTVVALLVAGVFQARRMPVDAFPDISPVMVPVFADGHGMAPEEIERLITYPIESAMNGLPGVSQIKSTSAFGMAVVYIYFRDDVDIYFARQIVAERMAGAMASLPEMDEPPKLGPISTGLGQIFLYYLDADPAVVDTGGKPLDTWLRELNDWVVKFQLQTVPGVTEILSIGGHVLQYQIRVNPDALLKYDLAMHDLVEAVRANNHNVGGQFLVLGSEEYLVRGVGLLSGLDDIRAIPIKGADGRTVVLADVAEIEYGNEIRRGVVTLNGEREVVSGLVLKLYDANTSEVIAGLYAKLESVRKTLPAGVTLVPYYEQAALVHNATSTVLSALWQGGLLVVITLGLFLGNLRSAFIVALSLPICACVSLLCMEARGLSANLMSLGGIAVAIGMLGDGAIVMVENIFRHLNERQDEGRGKVAFIAAAAREVSRPIVFSIVIVILVFAPIFALEGVEAKMFAPMAFSTVFALLGSLLVALFVAPVLALLLLKRSAHGERAFMRRLNAGYQPALAFAMRRRKSVLGAALALFLGSLLCVPHLGTEFIPTLEEGSILIGVGMAPSISLEAGTALVMSMEREIATLVPVKDVISRIGRPEAGSHPHPVNYAEVHIELKPRGEWGEYRNKNELKEALDERLASFPGVQLNFTQPIQNAFDELLSGIKAQLAIKVFGEDLEVLRLKADEIREAIAGVPGLVDLASEQSFGQPQVQVVADREACARYGVTVGEILELVELAVGGEVIDSVYLNTRRFGIHMRYQEAYRADPEAIRNLLVPTRDGGRIPLAQVAVVESVIGPIQISREHNQRRWVVQGNVRGRDLGGVVADIQREIAEKVTLPTGYSLEYGGQFENQQRAMKRLSLIVPVVLLLVFAMLWMAFNSVRQAALIMLNVPLALVGGILGLLAMGEYLSVPAAIGFIALFGIAVQNGMILVTYFNDLRAEGRLLDEAVREGARLRLRPVLMTAATTVLGLLPLLLSRGIGSEVQRPLATVVVFGLTTSTFLTLMVLPAAYLWLEEIQARRRGTRAG